VRARAASTKQATRREVEQSIARFEKRLDDANDALKTLGGNLGRGSQRSYKEVTAALAALRREAAKTNKQALKDFDSVKTALTQKVPARARSAAKKASTTTKKASTTTKKAAAGSTRTGSPSTASHAASSRSTGSRKAASRSTAPRSTSSRSTSSRSTGTRSKSTRAKKTS
jgi:DNA-binding protein HU-beta